MLCMATWRVRVGVEEGIILMGQAQDVPYSRVKNFTNSSCTR